MTAANFPVGYHPFHKKQVYNYQLNRFHSLGLARYEDFAGIGKNIKTFVDWRREMVYLAEKALRENRLMNAAAYYRAAEFYTFDTQGEKESLYDKFAACFQAALKEDNPERHEVPYQSGFLPVMRIPAEGKKKGTVVLHGGFDSFLEEWYFFMGHLAAGGYEVIGFEGPGQGAALKKYGLTFDTEWEKPVKAVLDFFKAVDVTLFGLSMGGWLCLRAAAFEPRIKRVIACGHAIDYMKCFPPLVRSMHIWLVRQKRLERFMEQAALKKAKANNGQGWITQQLMTITKEKNPMKAFDVWLEMNDVKIHSERVTQDVLLLSGSRDHFIPVKMHKLQRDALVNARSVTKRIFTEKESAQNHCQIGNIPLLLETVTGWLDGFPVTL